VLPPKTIRGFNMSFKKGDIGIIVGNTNEHEFPLGTKVRCVYDDRWEYLDGSDFWYLNEADVKLESVETIMDSVEDFINSDGGPSAYYDFKGGWKTWNDFADYKSTKQWKEHSFHLGNVGKVLCRWGDKLGTTKSYDARKIVYSGLRVLLMLEGKDSVKTYLKNLLEDEQFKGS